MKGLSFVLATSFLLMTTSCIHPDETDEPVFDKNVKHILFFSDDSDYRQEAPYYDAIIELKKEFPNEINNMKVFSEPGAKKYFEDFNVEKSPAIMVIYNDEVMVSVDGRVSKEQIVKPVTQVLEPE
ncbi:small peptidoglycan-associated lipoprotein [Bacillus sp. T33-2]|uniref:small peptidoglycan-associated lipoprotein n=1 Tax=Bacillus sp. T33-2 TaxID=2054168 RepID=UPI000C76A90B|nr:small peptidoglycan-associated lipoprotein [Bacillus sp. T33-2]PLR97445.1 small peptidoglycan-associated lipoprotein [Bacillus sp. T33-2]